MLRRIVPDVVCDQSILALQDRERVIHAARAMAERRVGSVLVMRGPVLVGIFTGTDMIGRVVAKGRSPAKTMLRTVMTPSPQTVAPSDLAIEALRMMQASGFRHLPVVDGDAVVGIVSRRDFLAEEEDEVQRERRIWEQVR